MQKKDVKWLKTKKNTQKNYQRDTQWSQRTCSMCHLYVIKYKNMFKFWWFEASQLLTVTSCEPVWRWQETPVLLINSVNSWTLLIETQTRGCAFLHLSSALWVEYVKFHSSVKSLSLCSSGLENKTVALAVSEMKTPPFEWEVRSLSNLVKSGRPPRRNIPQSAEDYRDAGHSHIVFMAGLCYISQSPINSPHCLQD